jgi:hypothetical protein
MKWALSIFASLLLAFCLPALAQSNTGNSNSTTNNSSQSGSSAGQDTNAGAGVSNQDSGPENETFGQAQRTGSTERIEGCIVRENTYYYLVPANGHRVRLNSKNGDVSKNEGHQVRIEGRESNGNSHGNDNRNTASNSGSQATGNNAQSGTSGRENEVVVDKLETISATCPPNSNSNSGSNGQQR